MQVVAAHKGGGMGIKGDDTNAVPLCVACHAIEHSGDRSFWEAVKAMYGKSRDDYVREHRRR